MARKAAKSTGVIAFDLGGTKIKAGIVQPSGKILSVLTESAKISEGPEAVVGQFAKMAQALQSHYPKLRFFKSIGVASAGPLDPKTGDLLDPTNFRLKSGKRWGIVPLRKKLERALQNKVVIDNDAACAVQGEQWRGGGKGCKNLALLTLGTGLGTAFICNNHLVRAGQNLHTEGGHVTLFNDDPSAPCGCGNYGCAEAYLSATGFAKRYSLQQKKPFTPREITQLASQGHRAALRAFEEYGRFLARSIHDYCVLFCPEKIALAGGFSECHPFFLESCQDELAQLLQHRRMGIDLLPEVYLSPLKSNAPLVGAACIALRA